jgi:hypothetical protein
VSRADLAGLFVAGSLLGLLLLAAMGEGEADLLAAARAYAAAPPAAHPERGGGGETPPHAKDSP